MRLFRHGAVGAERAGILDTEGRQRDLSAIVPDITADWLGSGGLSALATIDATKLPLVSEGTRLGCPVAGVRQFVAVGLNYRKHAEEGNMEIPSEPIVFNKAITCLCGPDDDTILPPGSTATDWEVELAIVIGQMARRVPEREALAHVAGFCLANDVSERDWQLKRNGQWGKGKSFDTFGPLGPWLVTQDDIVDPQNLPLSLAVNGETRQSSNTADMIFSCAQIVSYISSFQTLLPGDVIVTGTPQGVGLGMKPPKFLHAGDVVTLDGGVLGRQRQRVRAE